MAFSFNPRTHVGCDYWYGCTKCILDSFNPRTHVGCDLLMLLCLTRLVCFNPRTHVGCDGERTKVSTIIGEFQSTHPRRVRLHAKIGVERGLSFNPRTHVGCDYTTLFRLRMD